MSTLPNENNTGVSIATPEGAPLLVGGAENDGLGTPLQITNFQYGTFGQQIAFAGAGYVNGCDSGLYLSSGAYLTYGGSWFPTQTAAALLGINDGFWGYGSLVFLATSGLTPSSTESIADQVSGSPFARLLVSADGNVYLGGNISSGPSNYCVLVKATGELEISKVGGGLFVKEGTNATMGKATLVAGTKVVSTTKITSNSRVFLTVDGGTLTHVGTPYVSARTAGTSFTITSTNGSDVSDVAWLIVEPSP